MRWTFEEIGVRPPDVEVVVDINVQQMNVFVGPVKVAWFTYQQQIEGGECVIDWNEVRAFLAGRLVEGPT